MKISFFSTRQYEKIYFDEANQSNHFSISYFAEGLNPKTTALAKGYDVVCCFVNDQLDADVLRQLKADGVKLVALRCAGYNQVDVAAAKNLQMPVVRVPAYSPYSVAEHAVGMILALNRKYHRSYLRSIEHNFSLDGLMGFDLHGKTVGIVGTGKIGFVFAKIMQGFGCHLLGYDVSENPECLALGLEYCDKEELFGQSDIISLHCPLTPDTYHLINDVTLKSIKQGAMLVNTSRGGLIDATAVINALKKQQIGSLAIDVYEEEADIFFENLSEKIIQDDVFSRLLTFPNVLVTGHQAFFTKEAMKNIAHTALKNIEAFSLGNIENCIY